MSEPRRTQTQLILDYMAEFGSITALDAVRDLGCMRLAARISDLKKQGYIIESKPEAVLNRWGKKCNITRYSLGGEPQ